MAPWIGRTCQLWAAFCGRGSPTARAGATGLLLFAATFPSARAVVEDNNLWLQLAIAGPLLANGTERCPWRYTFDSPNRFGNDARQYSQGVWRAGLGYELNPSWSVWAGYGYTYTDTPYARAPTYESRAFQQLLWTGRSGPRALGYRLRLEERFPDAGSATGLRLRQQFRLTQPCRLTPRMLWVLWDEVFLNLNATDWGARRGLDQNRAFAGVGWQWSEARRTEVGYLQQFFNRPGRPNRVNHILSVSLNLAFR